LVAKHDKEEEYEEWLGRLDIPIENQTDKETLRGYLKEELGITGDAQVDALWDAVGISTSLGEHGIRQVQRHITSPEGDYIDVRYGIQGLPGLWGWESVREIREAEGW